MQMLKLLKKPVVAVLVAFFAAATVMLGIWVWQRLPRPLTVAAGQLPEELVYARSRDDVVSAGTLFSPEKANKAVAVIWVHGWGTNFYSPTYTNIGRALAAGGLATFIVNTRMHDLGNNATRRNGRRVRGGGYWGIQTEQDLDIAAWIDLAERLGYHRVVLAGHSAGWSAVSWYQARTQDGRVAGLISASGTVRPQRLPDQPKELAEARRLVAAGAADELIRLPNRDFPSYISAGTLFDQADTPPQLLDFFGVERSDGGVTKLNCPLLAFYGTNDDVGDDADLEIVKSAPTRLSLPDLKIETAMIKGADHMYTGEEIQVAELIRAWVQSWSSTTK